MFLLYVIDIYSKYTRVPFLKDKKAFQLLLLFKKFLMSLVENQTKYG